MPVVWIVLGALVMMLAAAFYGRATYLYGRERNAGMSMATIVLALGIGFVAIGLVPMIWKVARNRCWPFLREIPDKVWIRLWMAGVLIALLLIAFALWRST